MKITNELKTGMVVVAAVIVAIVFWVKTTDFSGKPYHVKTYFSYAEGVKQDSIVKLSGIEVGRVDRIRFQYEPETKVELILALNRNAKLREDSIAFISTSGLIGDAYIGLTPGSTGKPFAREGTTILSEDPIEMRELMKQADQIAKRLDLVLGDVKLLVADNREKVNNIVSDLEQTAANFNEFSEDIKRHPWKLLMKGK